MAENADLRAAIQSAVDDANRSVSRAESIRGFVVLPDVFTVEDGQLTPTLKVRRAEVEARYNDAIERIYGGRSTSGAGASAGRAANP